MQINVHFTFLSQYDPNQPIFLLAKLHCRCLSLEYFQLAEATSMSFYIQGHFLFWNKNHKQLLAVAFYSYQASIEKFKSLIILLLISMVWMLLYQLKKLTFFLLERYIWNINTIQLLHELIRNEKASFL